MEKKEKKEYSLAVLMTGKEENSRYLSPRRGWIVIQGRGNLMSTCRGRAVLAARSRDAGFQGGRGDLNHQMSG